MAEMDPHVEFDIVIEQAQQERKAALLDAEEALVLKADTLKHEVEEEQKLFYLAEVRYNVAFNRYNEEKSVAQRLYHNEVKTIEADYDEAITEARIKYRKALGHEE